MTAVNEYQVGGAHYKTEYQHWDWVRDLGFSYHAGCATKYLIRWRKKNGLQDLRKALHYLEKMQAFVSGDTGAEAEDVVFSNMPLVDNNDVVAGWASTKNFLYVNEVKTGSREWMAIMELVHADIGAAIFQVSSLITEFALEEEGGPTKAYVAQ